MSDTQKKIMTGLLSAVGAVSAFFGVRALMNRMRQGSEEQQYPMVDEEIIAVTGYEVTSIPEAAVSTVDMAQMDVSPAEDMSGWTDTQSNTSMGGMQMDDQSVDDPSMRGRQTGSMPTNDRSMSGQSTGSQSFEMPPEGAAATGQSEVGENYESRFKDQNAEPSIPTTGGMDAPVADMPTTQDRLDEMSKQNIQVEDLVQTDQPVMVGSLVGPFIVHLLSFHNMIKLLKTRRDTVNAADSNPDTPDVRAGGADNIGSLEGQLPEFDHAALVHNSLQERMITLMERIRDALQNLEYSDDQLFQIHDEMRPVICKTLDLIHQAQEDNVTGFDEVEQAYSCH